MHSDGVSDLLAPLWTRTARLRDIAEGRMPVASTSRLRECGRRNFRRVRDCVSYNLPPNYPSQHVPLISSTRNAFFLHRNSRLPSAAHDDGLFTRRRTVGFYGRTAVHAPRPRNHHLHLPRCGYGRSIPSTISLMLFIRILGPYAF